MREQRTELIGKSMDQLTLVNYENTYEIFTKEQFSDALKVLSESKVAGEIVSIKKIQNLAGQKIEFDMLAFNLERSVQMLETLTKSTFKYDVSSKEYCTAMENISNFIQTNIIDITKEKVEELDLLLQSIN